MLLPRKRREWRRESVHTELICLGRWVRRLWWMWSALGWIKYTSSGIRKTLYSRPFLPPVFQTFAYLICARVIVEVERVALRIQAHTQLCVDYKLPSLSAALRAVHSESKSGGFLLLLLFFISLPPWPLLYVTLNKWNITNNFNFHSEYIFTVLGLSQKKKKKIKDL